MKDLRAFVRLLNEGRFDKETTTLVREVLRFIASGMRIDKTRDWSIPKDFWDVDAMLTMPGMPKLYVRVAFEPTLDEPMASGAFSRAFGNAFMLKLRLPSTLIAGSADPRGRKHMSRLSERLRDLFRHEFEHLDQHHKGTLPERPTDAPNSAHNISGPKRLSPDDQHKMLAYLMQPHEIEAFVAGFYKNAKATRTPFNDIMDRRIGRFDKLYGMSREMLEPVRDAWIAHAKKRFPKAQGI